MTAGFARSRETFGEAARWFLATAAQVGERWEQPGLGEWDVRALVGHTSRSLITVESYLAQPAARVDVPTTADYYRVTRAIAAAPGVAARGREAGTALGADPVASLRVVADRVLGLVGGMDGSELLTTLAGGMQLSAYLPTRTFELTVHTCDLALVLDLPLDPPRAAAREALGIVTDLAVDDGRAGALLLAATGRPTPGGGLSVL